MKDNQICIGHTTGKSIRHTVFEWNGEEFRKALIEPAVKIEEGKYEWNEFYRMIADANLEGIRGSTLEELQKVDEYTRVFELTGFKTSFGDAYEDAFLQLSPHAKGVLPIEVTKEFLIEKLAEEFGLPKGLSITVDITGSNRGDYIFDVMRKDDGRLTFVGEAESRWADEGMDWSIFDKRIKEGLQKHYEKARSEGLALPEYGYGFIVIYRLDKITFYVRKLSFSTMDWVRW